MKMQIKFILYAVVTPFVVLALDSLNINSMGFSKDWKVTKFDRISFIE